MHVGHAHFSFDPLSVSLEPPTSAPALEPLSPLSDLSPSPPLLTNVQCPPILLASDTLDRSSQRRQDAAEYMAPLSQSGTPVRRMRPLACMSSNTNTNTLVPGGNVQASGGTEKSWKADAWTAAGMQQQQQQVRVQQIIEFPPKHVVLHPDDVNNKVFLAMGRALMSVNNCAMTIKDLAELSMQHGLVCQNVSAASQAITFFIRTHLTRCEEQNDFPLLLRHVLSGTPRDDALAPALYSRTGGNVSNKDKTARDENGNLKERITCFRRGTTVWYLSKAAGVPCPFARAGIALRDYSDCSAISSVEGRKGENDFTRGLKRKRERNLRPRAGSGPAARHDDDDDDSEEEQRPPKIKLTLRLRPCPTSSRQKTTEVDAEDSSSASSSDSDSDSDTQDEPMDVDTSARSSAPPPPEPSTRKKEPSWSFPPYPITRRISIPPYTPSEEIYPTVYTSPTTNFSTSTFFSSDWPLATKPLVCVDPPPKTPGPSGHYSRARAASVFSVASPPPESDDEFGFSDDDEDDVLSSMSPQTKFKSEEDLQYLMPGAASSTSSLDLPHIKSEPIDDLIPNEAGSVNRLSMQTIKQEKLEELDLDIASLSLSFPDGLINEADSFGSIIKPEDDGLGGLSEGFTWHQSVDLTRGESDPICEGALGTETAHDNALQHLWRNVELLGPETVCLQELEDGSWEESRISHDGTSSPSRLHPPLQQHDEDDTRRVGTSPSHDTSFISPSLDAAESPAFSFGSLSPPPSLTDSTPAGSVYSPETEIDSVGPASPPSFVNPESSFVVRNDESTSLSLHDVGRSSPRMIPGKPAASLGPSRQAVAVRSDDVPGIPLSEQSAPWERGMCTEEDVEKHLLEPPRPLAMMSIRLPAQTEGAFDNVFPAPEPPLSPQEEEVFQSLCICPDMSWEDKDQAEKAKQEPENVSDVDSSHEPDMTLTGVFAQATRPTMRLRERRPSKRLSELEQVRKQSRSSRPEVTEESDDAKDDSDTITDSIADAVLRRRGKDAVTHSTESTNSNKGPLRRSKRVANVVAMQRNRERLRKRTVS